MRAAIIGLLGAFSIFGQSSVQQVLLSYGGSAPPPAGISFVAAVSFNFSDCHNGGSGRTTASLNVAAGDLLLIGETYNGSSGLAVPTTNDSETAVIVGSAIVNAWTGSSTMAVYRVDSASANATKTINVAPVGTSPCNVVVMQFRGALASGEIDQNPTNNGNFAPTTAITIPPPAGTFTPGVSGEAGVTFAFLGSSPTAGNICGSSATIPTNGSTAGFFAAQYLLNIGTSTCTMTMTSGSGNLMGIGVTVKPQ